MTVKCFFIKLQDETPVAVCCYNILLNCCFNQILYAKFQEPVQPVLAAERPSNQNPRTQRAVPYSKAF